MINKKTASAAAAALLCHLTAVHAQTAETEQKKVDTLPAITARAASADASKDGLQPAYAGGQVARGGRAGVLGTKDNMDTPFSITAYTNELIQDQQARSVGDVLQNDSTVRIARGFGNFQQTYFIRGFLLNNDDVAYNGLYSILPRQTIGMEAIERVELLRGASAFVMGANPGGTGGIGGVINLVPKRAPNEALNRVTFGVESGSQVSIGADIARRFGPDNATGVRLNVAHRNGGTSVAREKDELGLATLGLDWHSRNVRLSADAGWQESRLQRTRSSITLAPTLTSVPSAPDGHSNQSPDGSFSNERDLFGTLRAEMDLNDNTTAWAAYGTRYGREGNALAGQLLVTDAASGDANYYRFDNARKDTIRTGEVGVRSKFSTGSIKHEVVLSGSHYQAQSKNAFDYYGATTATNLYAPLPGDLASYNGSAPFSGGDINNPALTISTRLTSISLGDTLSLFNDRLLFTAGARQQRMSFTERDYNSGAPTAGFPYEKNRLSPVAAVVFKINPRTSVYANYTEGLSKGETINVSGSGLVSLPPYVSRQKEVGVKVDTGRLGGSAALFTTSKPRAVLSGNADGSARHTGLELSAYGEAMRNVRVLGGLTLLDTEQRRTSDPAVDGKRTIGVPKVMANIGLDADVPGVPGLAFDTRLVYTGKVYAKATNTLEVPDWTRWDLGGRYTVSVDGKPVTLRARLHNVANRSYWASSGGYPGAGYLNVGLPRTFLLSASVDF